MALAHVPDPGERSPERVVADLLSSGSITEAEAAELERHRGGGEYDAGAQYATALDVLRELAKQEYERGERFASKARQAFGFGTIFFGAVQVAALSALSQFSTSEDKAVLICAIVAVAGVFVTAILAIAADAQRRFRNLSSDDVIDSVNGAIDQGAPASFDLSQLFARAVDERHEAVDRREKWLVATQISAALTVVVLAGELILAIAARL